ncbi:MAG: YitT family protein [Clostridia bacterium]|nr:YitT family protein [Clostridia bacterium]
MLGAGVEILKRKNLLEYGLITLGCLITAVGLDMFLVPNRIASGGVSGLATITFHLFGLPVGLVMLALNIPLFLASIKILGPQFGLKTLYGFFVLSVFIDTLSPITKSPTSDPVLAALFGGIMSGLGLGIVFKAGGTTGGTDLAAQLIRKFFKTTTGQGLFMVDGLVILLAGMAFTIELALYALIAVFIATKIIDLVQEGVGSKAALIISNNTTDIAESVMSQLGRGATLMEGVGAYTLENKGILLTVVGRWEVTRLKTLVSETDPAAFVIVADVHEVLGEGFKNIGEI